MTTYDPSAARSGAIFSDNPLYPGAWLCYVNGVEVPIKGFELTYGVWMIPEFTIHMVPDILIQRLGYEDRVQVALFYLDSWAGEQREFRLLCDGEIVGTGWSTVNGERVRSFECVAHIDMFQMLYFFFMNTLDDVVAAQDPAVRTAGVTQAGLFYPYSLFHTGLFTPSLQLDGSRPATGARDRRTFNPLATDDPETPADDPIKAPFELVYNVVRGLIGTGVPEDRRSIPAVSYFARAVRRNRLHRRFVRLPDLEDVANLNDRHGVFPIFAAVRSDEALGAMQRQIAGTIANSGSVWDMLKSALSMVYMEIAMIPTAGCFTTNLECEIQHAFRADEPLQAQVPPLPTPANVSIAGPTNVPPVTSSPRPTTTTATGTTQGYDPTRPATLAQYFVKPQFMTGVAPMCNVVYPSMLDQYGGNESYKNQPTRLYVNDSVMTQALRAEGSARDMMLHALTVAWPPEADLAIRNTVGGSDQINNGTPGHRLTGKNILIWPEEYYAGPRVARMALPRFFQFMQQARNTVDADGGNGTPSTGVPAGAATSGAAATSPNGASDHHGNTPADAGSQPVSDNRASATIRADLRAAATPSAGPVVSTRGRIQPGIGTFTDLWEMDEATYAAQSARGNLPYHSTPLLSLAEAAAAVQAQGEINLQGPILPGTIALQRFLDRTFTMRNDSGSRWVPSVGAARDGSPPPPARGQGRSRATAATIQRKRDANARRPGGPLPEARVQMRDGHQQGRALDIMIRKLRPGVGNINIGNPLANWLVLHAHQIGIQLVIWGRRFWCSANSAGRRFGNYSQGASTDDDTAHVSHIHMELNDAGAAGQTPWFTQPSLQSSIPLPRFENLAALPPPRPVTVSTTRPIQAEPGVRTVERRTTTTTNPTTGTVTAAGGTAASPSGAATPPQATTAEGQTSDGEESFQSLFRLYAQYEFLRQRYLQRNVGATMQFNPYVIPGFPCFIFDTMTMREHTVGYVVSVTQSGFTSSGNTSTLGTKISVSCTRQLSEFVQDIINDTEYFADRIVAAPAETIDEVRAVIQKEDRAETFYSRLLYGETSRPDGFPASFHLFDTLGYATDGIDATRIRSEATTETQTVRTVAEATPAPPPVTLLRDIAPGLQASISNSPLLAQAFRPFAGPLTQLIGQYGSLPVTTALDRVETDLVSQTNSTLLRDVIRTGMQQVRTLAASETPPPAAPTPPDEALQTVTVNRVSHTLDPNRELVPLPDSPAFQAFQSYDVAMRLAARPVCTLTQYIRFLHGGRTVNDLIASGDVELSDDAYGYEQTTEVDVTSNSASTVERSAVQRSSSVYYARIFKLRQGPGTPPNEAQRGYSASGPVTTTAALPADYPQTRAPWDTNLIRYREKVRRRVSPSI